MADNWALYPSVVAVQKHAQHKQATLAWINEAMLQEGSRQGRRKCDRQHVTDIRGSPWWSAEWVSPSLGPRLSHGVMIWSML